MVACLMQKPIGVFVSQLRDNPESLQTKFGATIISSYDRVRVEGASVFNFASLVKNEHLRSWL
jgi:hypothetical protein